MSLVEIFRAIFINIRENKVKVFLTSLGIIVGSLTIVMVIGIGTGAQVEVEEQFKTLNAGSISLSSGRDAGSLTLDESILEAIKEEAPSISDVTMYISGSSDVSYYNETFTAGILAAKENYKDLVNLNIEYGEFITDYDSENREKVAVIGSDVVEELFGEGNSEEAVGNEIIIKGKKYEVIGVLERVGGSMPGFNPDEGVILPYSTAQKYIIGNNRKPAVTALAIDMDHVSLAIEEITQVLQDEYKEKANSFMIRDTGSMLVAAQDSARTMSILLISIAIIVLVVGGIGIMNVLLVSVKERTKEIGILKAIGARRKDILLQFLFEAIVISGSGGVVGILVSMLIMPIMNNIDLTVIPSLYGYFMALVFSVVTGTFFGYYPASKAASLKPIDALNYE